jgi:hypothetical protein
MKDGIYCYDAKQIPLAHKWCFIETRKALESGENVVVTNTFTTAKELYSYFLFNPKVYKCEGNYKNTHNVPEEVIQKMRNRWENIEGEIIV